MPHLYTTEEINLFNFIYELIHGEKNIRSNKNEIYKLFNKYINNQYIDNLLDKYNGIEIYNIIKCKRTMFEEINSLFLFWKLKYNIDITYCKRYYTRDFFPEKYRNTILLNNIPIIDFFIKAGTDKILFNDIKELFKKLNKLNIRHDKTMLFFENDKLKRQFGVELCKKIIDSNYIIFETICKKLYKSVFKKSKII